MVILYTGTPGSGKSYHATKMCHDMTRKKVYVIANFFVHVKNSEYFVYINNDVLCVEYLLYFSRTFLKKNKESQVLLIIDEASIKFNCRDFSKSDRSNWLKYFSQHRKLGYDVILITQMDRSLDRQIRGVIEYQYIHRKLTNFGLKGLFIKLITGKSFLYVRQWYQIREKIGVEYFGIKKKIAESYDTYSMFEEG